MKKATSRKRRVRGNEVSVPFGYAPSMTAAQQARLARLAAMKDEDIDFSDIPEVTDFTGFKRGMFYRPVKQQITLRVDADVLTWFRSHKKKGYQTEINQALRQYVMQHRRKRKGKAA
jgi:uncharacterized protein (DUF4415 family)